MKTTVRIIAAVLIIAMAIPLFACAENNEKPNEATTAGQENGQSEEQTVDAVPVAKADYNAEFKMLSLGYMSDDWYTAEKSTGEILNDTVYAEIIGAKDRLGVDVVYETVGAVTTGNEIYDKYKPTFEAGDDEYQLMIMHPYYSINSLITKNMVLDFGELDRLNLDSHYWNTEEMEKLAIKGGMYVGLCDYCSLCLDILYFNKNFMNDLRLEAPYEQVRNGEWTLDEFLEISDNGYKDLNGMGDKDPGDKYGFACMWDANGSTFQQACGIYTLTKNEEGAFDITIYDENTKEKTVEVYAKIYNLLTRQNSYIWDFAHAMSGEGTIDFKSGNVLFTHAALSNGYLNAPFGVGILPMPKYDTNQKNYAHVNWGNVLMIPITVQDTDMVSDTLEYLSYYSDTYVEPAYYENVLGAKVADTQDDWDMIKIIYDTIVFDPGIALCHSTNGLYNLTYLYCFTYRQKGENIVSFLKPNVKLAEKELKKLFK